MHTKKGLKMEINNKNNSPAFQMKRVEYSGGTLLKISEKIDDIMPEIISLGDKDSVLTTRSVGKHYKTKISLYKEIVLEQPQTLLDKVRQKLTKTNIKKIPGESITVDSNISLGKLRRVIIETSDNSMKKWAKLDKTI